jgi:ketosteroid isomerase-like protein
VVIVLVSADFDQLIEQYHQVVAEFVKGDPEPAKRLFSSREDVCLANPFGGIMRGWKSVAETVESAASLYKEGIATFQNIVTYATADFAYLVEVEEYKAKLGERNDISTVSLRVTSIFRLEDGVWKLAHRHSDPLTDVRSKESVIKEHLCIGSRCYF